MVVFNVDQLSVQQGKKYKLTWLRVRMPFHIYNNLSKLLNGDIATKIGKRIYSYKHVLLDYLLCVCPAFLFPVQISDFYAKYRSLYTEAFVILSKWPAFYAKVLV